MVLSQIHECYTYAAGRVGRLEAVSERLSDKASCQYTHPADQDARPRVLLDDVYIYVSKVSRIL
jgi:hypothetical protein